MADRMMMERTFSMPRKEPAEILQEESDEEGERINLIKLWTKYWNAWEYKEVGREVAFWDKQLIRGLLSPNAILLKPEGFFRGKEMILNEYDNFAKRFSTGSGERMNRRLRFLIVDEVRRVTTALYDVIIPSGILAEQDQQQEQEHERESERQDAGGTAEGEIEDDGADVPSSSSLGAKKSEPCSIYSVAEVIKWNLMVGGQIKEIHYYGGGVQLVSSSLKGKLDRARQHNQRLAGAGDDSECVAAELSSSSIDIGFEEVVLDTSTVSDDRPLAALSLKYLESLLKLDGEVLPSLVADSYKHLTAFGDSFKNRQFGHDSQQGSLRVKGSIDSIYIDERRQVVSIERKYQAGEEMSEIIDILHWQEQDQRVSRHSSYGFSWSSSKPKASVAPAEVASPFGEGYHLDRNRSVTSFNKRERDGERFQGSFKKSKSGPRVAFL